MSATVETPDAEVPEIEAPETCPRCHTTQEWGQSSWCPNCNYYPVVDSGAEDGTSWADDLPDMPVEDVDNRTALESIPVWFWTMLAGVVGLAVFSVAVRMTFADDDVVRGQIALTQLVIGLISMLVAHGLSAKLAFKTDRRVSLNDVVLSWFNIWQPTITRLPETCKRVWAVVWGGVAFITAVTIIGGIDYSAPFRTHKAPKTNPLKLVGKVAAAARAGAANKPQSMEEAMADLQSQVAEMEGEMGAAGGAPVSMEDALNGLDEGAAKGIGMGSAAAGGAKTASDEIMKHLENKSIECFVYGVVTNSKNVPTSFLFAANTKGNGDQHVAEVKADTMPRERLKIIAVRLYKEVCRTPCIETDRKAVWVNPKVVCRLKFKELLEDGQLTDAEIDAIVVNQRGVRD